MIGTSLFSSAGKSRAVKKSKMVSSDAASKAAYDIYKMRTIKTIKTIKITYGVK